MLTHQLLWAPHLETIIPTPAQAHILYCLTFFEVENFHGFRGSESGCENFIPRNFKFITDARHGWKLDCENFICENLFLSRIWQNWNIQPLKILGYTSIMCKTTIDVMHCTCNTCTMHTCTCMYTYMYVNAYNSSIAGVALPHWLTSLHFCSTCLSCDLSVSSRLLASSSWLSSSPLFSRLADSSSLVLLSWRLASCFLRVSTCMHGGGGGGAKKIDW